MAVCLPSANAWQLPASTPCVTGPWSNKFPKLAPASESVLEIFKVVPNCSKLLWQVCQYSGVLLCCHSGANCICAPKITTLLCVFHIVFCADVIICVVNCSLERNPTAPRKTMGLEGSPERCTTSNEVQAVRKVLYTMNLHQTCSLCLALARNYHTKITVGEGWQIICWHRHMIST